MPLLNIPESRDVLAQRTRADVQQALAESNPFLRNSMLDAIIKGYDGRIFEFYQTLQIATSNLFANTSVDEFLEGWADFKDLSRNDATSASGRIVATGTPGSTIGFDEEVAAGGKTYIVQATGSISSQTLNITTLVRSGSTVTATTANSHGLSSNIDGVISGAVETDYNGTFTITVTAANKFTYQIATTPTTPATGTIVFDIDFVSLLVVAEDFGQDTNLIAGTKTTLVTPIAGVNNELFVDFDTVGGGADIETNLELLVRVKEAFAFPKAYWGVNFLVATAKEVSGVTRVFVEEITPAVGQVTIYFLRDNDDNPIPDGSEVQAVRDVIIAAKPVDRDPSDIFVLSPTAIITPFDFSALAPNTATMQAAVSANLQQLFDENTAVGQDLTEDAYRSTIFNTIDPQTGQRVTDFDLTDPVGDIVANTGEIPTFGGASYP